MSRALNTSEPGKSTLGDETNAVTSPMPNRKRSATTSSSVVVDIGARSHRGLVRTNNEDSFLVNTLERRMTTLRTNLPPSQIPENYFEIVYGMIVADGMGGAAAGEVASRTAIAALVDLIIATPDWIMRLDEEGANRVLKRTEERIGQLATALAEATRVNPEFSGMGTTLTVAASLGSDLLIAHVRFIDCSPTPQARRIESKSFFEAVFSKLIDRKRKMVPRSGEIGKPNRDKLCLLVFGIGQYILGVHFISNGICYYYKNVGRIR